METAIGKLWNVLNVRMHLCETHDLPVIRPCWWIMLNESVCSCGFCSCDMPIQKPSRMPHHPTRAMYRWVMPSTCLQQCLLKEGMRLSWWASMHSSWYAYGYATAASCIERFGWSLSCGREIDTKQLNWQKKLIRGPTVWIQVESFNAKSSSYVWLVV